MKSLVSLCFYMDLLWITLAIQQFQCSHRQVERAWRRQQELLLDLIRLTQTDLEKPARQKVDGRV